MKFEIRRVRDLRHLDIRPNGFISRLNRAINTKRTPSDGVRIEIAYAASLLLRFV